MASAYYPKNMVDEPDGMGLVVFDEAFNNLDAPNTRALLEFFSDLHLQVIVAAPDKVRAMFLETADTIVSVKPPPRHARAGRDRDSPFAPGARGLAEINPVNFGVDSYARSIRRRSEAGV
jgi:hypothetical protein